MGIEQDLYELGIDTGRLWQHTSEVSQAEDIAHNAMRPHLAAAGQISAKFRRFTKRSGRAVEMLITAPEARAALAQEYGLKPRELQAIDEAEGWLARTREEAAAEGIEIGHIPDYIHEVRTRMVRGGVENPYRWEGMDSGFEFIADYAQHHRLDMRKLNIDDMMVSVTRAWKLKRHLEVPLELVKSEWDHPQVRQYLPNIHTEVKGWLHQIRFGYNSDDDMVVSSLTGLFRMFGLPVSQFDVMQFLGGTLTSMYRAGLGHRVSAITRDSIQPFYTGTKIGFQPVVDAYRKWFFGSAAERKEMIDRLVDWGVLVRGQVQVPSAELFGRSPLLPSGGELFTPRQQAARERLSGAVDKFVDHLPEKYRLGIQGTMVDPLLLYTKLGEMNRLISGEAGYQQARKALDKFREGKLTAEQFRYQSRIDHYEAPVQRLADRLIEQGRDDDFLKLMASEAANFQFRYGTREAPPALRSFAGKFAMQYGTFSNQYAAYTGSALFARGVSYRARAEFVARNAAIGSLLWYVGEEQDWDMMKWYWPTSLAFGGGPLGTMLILGSMAAAGRVRESIGAGQPTVEQEAAAHAVSRGWDLRGGLPGQFFPWAGTVRTANDIDVIMRQPPGERVDPTLEWMLTGRPFSAHHESVKLDEILGTWGIQNPAGGAQQ